MPLLPSIDDFLAAALRGEGPVWPDGWGSEAGAAKIVQRADYHGVAALLVGAARQWPAEAHTALRARGFAQAAWELRHRALLDPLMTEFSARSVRPLFLKGTALAYFAYDEPALRGRADSDLLVRPRELDAARAGLSAAGFHCERLAQGDLQETWAQPDSGERHVVDLHWASFNSHFLAQILSVEECFANAVPLPRLAPNALMLAPAFMLMHIAIHRNMHRTAPYFSGGEANYSADRLIWAQDIRCLTSRFVEADWQAFAALALEKGVARAMVDALEFCRRVTGAEMPEEVVARLRSTTEIEPRSRYLLHSSRRDRALANMATVGPSGRWRHVRSLLSPPDKALRARYPQMAGAPRFLLLARRLFDFAFSGRR